jgi:hypothetical protein
MARSGSTPALTMILVRFPLLLTAVILLIPALSVAQGVSPERPQECAWYIDSGVGDLDGAATEYARLAEIAGAAPLQSRLARRTSDERTTRICDATRLPSTRGLRLDSGRGTLSARLLPLSIGILGNSAYPDDRNAGGMWAGRGLNGAASAGAAVRWGPLSAAVAPRWTYHENSSFDLIDRVRPEGYSPFIYPWHATRIDWPQRFDTTTFRTTQLGQSYVRVDAAGFTAGASTENLWWGPSQRNPLILSNTAPGFPHIFIGTSRLHATPIGDVGAHIVWGRLEESGYFRDADSDGRRLFAGAVAELRPAGVPGLFLGLARGSVVQATPGTLSLADVVLAPLRIQTHANADSDPPTYQVTALFARWVMPEAGFEVYGEWALRGPLPGLDALLREPERGRGYTLGFQKLLRMRQNWVRLHGEHTNLAGSNDEARDGGAPAFYTDTRVPHGYTHRGQMLGAAIGPGSNAQILGVDLHLGRGLVGVFAERTRRDADAYYAHWTRYYAAAGHDIEIGAGLRGQLRVGPVKAEIGIAQASRRNRSFLRLDGFGNDFLKESNVRLRAGLTWLPPGRMTPH